MAEKRSTTEKMDPEVAAGLESLNKAVTYRRTKDMMILVKMPEFLRFIGRWTVDCGVHRAIDTTESNNFFRAEGRREIGERLLAEVEKINLEASFDVKRGLMKDERLKSRIKSGMTKFSYVDFVEKITSKGV